MKSILRGLNRTSAIRQVRFPLRLEKHLVHIPSFHQATDLGHSDSSFHSDGMPCLPAPAPNDAADDRRRQCIAATENDSSYRRAKIALLAIKSNAERVVLAGRRRA